MIIWTVPGRQRPAHEQCHTGVSAAIFKGKRVRRSAWIMTMKAVRTVARERTGYYMDEDSHVRLESEEESYGGVNLDVFSILRKR